MGSRGTFFVKFVPKQKGTAMFFFPEFTSKAGGKRVCICRGGKGREPPGHRLGASSPRQLRQVAYRTSSSATEVGQGSGICIVGHRSAKAGELNIEGGSRTNDKGCEKLYETGSFSQYYWRVFSVDESEERPILKTRHIVIRRKHFVFSGKNHAREESATENRRQFTASFRGEMVSPEFAIGSDFREFEKLGGQIRLIQREGDLLGFCSRKCDVGRRGCRGKGGP